jgi:hypothetical protein
MCLESEYSLVEFVDLSIRGWLNRRFRDERLPTISGRGRSSKVHHVKAMEDAIGFPSIAISTR